MLAWHGPVDGVKVEVIGAKIGERLLDLLLHRLWTLVDCRRPHLARDEQLRPRHAALCDAFTDGLLVRIELGAVEEAVAELKGGGDALPEVCTGEVDLEVKGLPRGSACVGSPCFGSSRGFVSYAINN